jgi:hypothetical protein
MAKRCQPKSSPSFIPSRSGIARDLPDIFFMDQLDRNLGATALAINAALVILLLLALF